MVWLIFLAATSDIGYDIIAKWTLKKQKLSAGYYNALLFCVLAIFSGIVWYFFASPNNPSNHEILSFKNLGLFALMIALSSVWNFLNTKALKHENIDNYEMIYMVAPLFTVLFSIIFIASERNLNHFIAAMIVSLTLILTHIRKRHFSFSRYDLWLIGAVVLIALEAVIIKILLGVWSLFSLYFYRTLIEAIIFLLIAKPHFKTVTKKQWQGILAVGLLGTIYKISQYVGYDQIGVTLTTMILVTSPFIVLVLDKFLLKEKLHLKYIVGMIVIALTITWALR